MKSRKEKSRVALCTYTEGVFDRL